MVAPPDLDKSGRYVGAMGGGPRGAELRRATATIGLLAVVALGVGAGRPTKLRRPAAVEQLVVDTSFVLLLVAMSFGLVFVVWLLWPEGQEEQAARAKRSNKQLLMSLLLLAGALALFGVLRSPGEATQLLTPPPPVDAGDRVTAEAENERAVVQPRWAGIAVAVGLLVVAGGAAATLAYLRFRRRPEEVASVPTPTPLDLVALVSLEALDAEADDRRAVLAAYAAMEMVLAAEGLGRRPSETPYEHVDRALADLGASAPVVRALTDLFATARYSLAPLEPGARAEARRRLDQLTGRFGVSA